MGQVRIQLKENNDKIQERELSKKFRVQGLRRMEIFRKGGKGKMEKECIEETE